ncbi:ATP-binding cassette domain-containing protein [Streptomyces sp. NPDC088358]|uniref:ATP-binding cassette domain-containing protein n=1 Tax=Streptomyces sp. NPDC088358 TaxID=3365857 RepID=UPI003806897C
MSTDAFLAARPCVRGDVVFGPSLVRGADRIHLLMDPRTGRRLELGPKEHFIIARLDGSHSLDEIGQAYAGEFGARLGEAQWGQMLRLLHGRDLLDGGPAPAAVSSTPPTVPRAGHPPSGILAGRTRLVADAPALMDRLHRVTAPARRPAVLTLLVVLAVALLAAVTVQAGPLWRQTEETARQPALLLAVGCVLWCSLALHELAHGLFARAWGGRVTEVGLRWILGATYLYCTVEDVQFLGSRGRKVATACAGVFANLLFLVPFYAVWALLPAQAQARPALGALLLLGVVSAVANLLPLPPLDGYRALGHALGVTQLATGSRDFAGIAVRAAFRRGPGLTAYPPRLRVLYGGFVLLTAVQSAALLVLCGAALRVTLPDGLAVLAWWLPVALLAAVLLLWALGSFGRSRRTTPAATSGPTQAPAPDGRAPAASPKDQGAGPTPPTATSGHPTPATGTGPLPHGPSPRIHPRKEAMSAPESKSETAAEAVLTESLPAESAVGVTATETVVAVDGVTKRYGEVTALDGVSLDVRHGEFFGILGPNGAGKTTLVEIVGGMREADSGSVTVFGQSPWPRDTALLARIGVQTQASAFFARLTAGEHLRTVAALYGMDPTAATTALERVNLTEKENARVDHLSGGQRQRLAVATALLHEPDLIFLDEPTAALDPEARRELWDVLRSLRAEGRTIICTTHYLEEAEALCDRVAIIAGGRVVALDTPRNLIRSLAAPTRLFVPAAGLSAEAAVALAGVDRATVQGDDLVLETTVPNRVLTALGDLVDIDTVTVRTPTLEDAYLTLTGTGSEHHR